MLGYQWTQQAPFQWTRIDMLIALLEEAVRVLERLRVVVTSAGVEPATLNEAKSLWQRGRLLVSVLLSGVNPEIGEPGRACWRLYEFVLHVLEQQKIEALGSAIQVLRTILEGFQEIRLEAVSLERQGLVQGLDGPSAGVGVVV